MPIDHDRVQAFRVFAEHLNFTRAARALALTQPALHTKIKRLSEELDVTLYRRRGRQLELTSQGVEVLRYARHVHELGHALEIELRAGSESLPVVLAAGEGACLYLLGSALRRYRRSGSAPLRLLTRDRNQTLSAVQSGEAHVGVAALDVLPEGLAVERLTEVQAAVAVPKTDALAKRKRVRLADLERRPMVLPPAGRPQRATIETAMRSAGVGFQVAVEATGWPLALHCVRLGLGLAIVNACCRPPAGVVLRALSELPKISYFVVSPRDVPLRQAASELRDVLISEREAWREQME